jgi:hypothetical protein
VLTEGEADVVVAETVTLGASGASASKMSGVAIGGAGGVGGKSRSVEGDYLSGVTALANRNGEIITSASWDQRMQPGGILMPPEEVARNGAVHLLAVLETEGLKRR